MPSIPPKLERAVMVLAMTFALITEPLAGFLWARLGRKALAVVLAALVGLLALPWVAELPLWWTLAAQLPLSWLMGGVAGSLLVKWGTQRGRLKLMRELDLNNIGGRPLWYGLDGNPIDIAEASELLGNHFARTIALTHIDGWRISTVFLVLDHNLTGQGAPVLWETMVFSTEGDVEAAQRYTSREDAQRGHTALVADVRNVFRQMRKLGKQEVPKPNGDAS